MNSCRGQEYVTDFAGLESKIQCSLYCLDWMH